MKTLLITVTITALIVIIVFIASGCNGKVTNKNITKNEDNIMKNDEALIKVPVTVGLGTLDIVSDPHTLDISPYLLPVALYRTENDEIPIDTLSFTRDTEGVWHYETKNLQSLNPYEMFGGLTYETVQQIIGIKVPKPPVIKFRVLERIDKFYRVVIDESNFATVVIRKDPDYMEWECDALSFQEMLPLMDWIPGIKGHYFYETWEQLLLRALHISFNDNSAVSVYDTPDGKKIFEEKQTVHSAYKVTEVRGDWAKIKDAWAHERDFEGWVKWKDNTKILVRIVEYMSV